LAGFPQNHDPNLLVGYETHDDAGIYRLNDEMAIITTADFITPPVNDPFVFGQIAAANALSDVYAMGGRPITCLNLASFPSKILNPEVLNQIVAGGLSKITEAGAVLAGGHTINDDEPKFGLAVTGIVHPEKFWTNEGAEVGDDLILTKPIGSGVIFNANLKNWVSADALDECLAIITTLNKTTADIMSEYDIHAATDITGFGLAGHSFEIARRSGVRLEIRMDDIPLMREALEMYKKGVNTGSNHNNRELVENNLVFKKTLPTWHQEIIFDPQTSGGLMAALPHDQSQNLLKSLHHMGVKGARIIGSVKSLQDSAYLAFN
jgi:selenide,water dikinase